jgi:hypothetical protein
MDRRKSLFKIASLLFSAASILLLPTTASATITFDGSGTTVFQQTANSPCVIGNNSCNQPTGFTAFQDPNGAGGGGIYDFFSPVYQAITPFTAPGSFNGNKIPTAFTIGIDENIAAGQGAETLIFFRTLLCTDGTGSSCAIVAANSYQPGSPTTIPNINNGNGFSDALLLGFSLTANSFYKFEASVGNDTDGMEQFFVIPANTPAVPEPITSALVGTGLVALFLVRRRRAAR